MTLRILVANSEQDEDRSAKVVARTLADAGHEVVYAGTGQSPAMIAATAEQEAVDAVAVVASSMVLASDVPVKLFTTAVTPAEILAWVETVV